VLANGNTPEWTGTEQGLSKRRERVKYNNFVAFLAAFVGGRDVRIEKVRWPPPGRINCCVELVGELLSHEVLPHLRDSDSCLVPRLAGSN
jgi:hypothetical protein